MIAEVRPELECDKVPAMPVYFRRNQPEATTSVCDSDRTEQHRDSDIDTKEPRFCTWITSPNKDRWEKTSMARYSQADTNSRSFENSTGQRCSGHRVEQVKERTCAGRKGSEAKAADVQRAKRERKSILSAHLMDPCHLKNAELPEHRKKNKGRVVHPEDNVKDEVGYGAVFTEHGASQRHRCQRQDSWTRCPNFLV